MARRASEYHVRQRDLRRLAARERKRRYDTLGILSAAVGELTVEELLKLEELDNAALCLVANLALRARRKGIDHEELVIPRSTTFTLGVTKRSQHGRKHK